MSVLHDRSSLRDGGPRHSNILDNLTLSFLYDKMKNSLLIKLFKCDSDPQRKELLTELHFTPTSGLRINSYEKNHNERGKKKRNEVFTFQHLRYITSCIVAPHARLVSVFISFTTRWLPGRPKLRYFQFSILIYNAMSACLSVNFELLSNFTPNNLHLEQHFAKYFQLNLIQQCKINLSIIYQIIKGFLSFTVNFCQLWVFLQKGKLFKR